jgi:hypothetical protein
MRVSWSVDIGGIDCFPDRQVWTPFVDIIRHVPKQFDKVAAGFADNARQRCLLAERFDDPFARGGMRDGGGLALRMIRVGDVTIIGRADSPNDRREIRRCQINWHHG